MKAIRIHQPGDVSALRFDDIAVPEPAPGEARVKIAAAGLNFIDIYHRIGMYKLPLPATLGMEGAGVVDKVGEGVTSVKPGDRVAYTMTIGSYAEYAVVPAWRLAPLPDAVKLEFGAAVMLQGMTAHYLAKSTYPLAQGDTCVVHAAAGGLGHLLVQIAHKCGATVIATAGSDEKCALALRSGADFAINYRERDFEVEVKDIMGGKGVDVVYDSVGKDTFLKSLNCLRPRGYGVLCGASSGPVEPFDLQRLNPLGSLFVTRPTLGHYTQTREELLWRSGELFDWIAKGELDVRIDRSFPLDHAGEAHQYIEARMTKGKVVLNVGGA